MIINQQPANYTPAYNEQLMEVTEATAYPNFRFYIEVKDFDSGTAITNPLRVPKRPNANNAFLNLCPFTKSYIENELQSGGATNTPNNYKCIKVEVGTEYTQSWTYDDFQYNNTAGLYFGNVKLVAANNHPYQVGDQINVQQNAGFVNDAINGLHTVVAVLNSKEIVIDLPFTISGGVIGGVVTYSDNRKVVNKNVANFNYYVYNGVMKSNDFKRLFTGNEYTTTPRKIATNLKSGFKVMDGFNGWINVYNFNGLNPKYWKVTTNDGFVGTINASIAYLSTTYYLGSDTAKFTTTNRPTLILPTTKTIDVFLVDNSNAVISEVITLEVMHKCTPDLTELLYVDSFGSYLPFYFRRVSEETKQVNREQLTDIEGVDKIIGARSQRSWLLRTDILNAQEIELFNIMLASPDVRMKIGNDYERVIITTDSDTTANNKVRKTKELTVRLASKDEVNI